MALILGVRCATVTEGKARPITRFSAAGAKGTRGDVVVARFKLSNFKVRFEHLGISQEFQGIQWILFTCCMHNNVLQLQVCAASNTAIFATP